MVMTSSEKGWWFRAWNNPVNFEVNEQVVLDLRPSQRLLPQYTASRPRSWCSPLKFAVWSVTTGWTIAVRFLEIRFFSTMLEPALIRLNDRIVKPITRLCLLPKRRIYGAVPPFSSHALTHMKTLYPHIVNFWVMTRCSLVGGYKCFG
jgi:hypothetical protein